MTDEQLWPAILADPDADEPRLAYAAAADRRGDPRGELIRLQIEARNARQAGWRSAQSFTQWDRINALLTQHKEDWLAPVVDLVDEARIRRGFVEDVTLSAQAFLSCAEELVRRAPIRHLRLTEVRPVIKQLAESPWLARMVSLDLGSNGLRDDDLRELVGSPYLHHLRMLTLSRNELTREGVETVAAASSALPNLEVVHLSGNRVEDPSETYGADENFLTVRPEGIELPPFGKELEARYGYQKWLHGPSRLTDRWPVVLVDEL